MQPQKRYIYILLIICHSILAQKSNSNYTALWHSADDNTLPQNSVKSIAKDNSGYIWLATENGLVRYDGQHFKTFNSENSIGIKSNRMRYFYGNPNLDTIYIRNDIGQYFTIINRQFKFIQEEKILAKFKSSYTKNKKTGTLIEDQKIHLKNYDYYRITADSILFLSSKNKTLFETPKFSANKHFVFNTSGRLFISEYGNQYFSLVHNKFYIHTFDFKFVIDQIFRNDLMQQSLIQSGENLYFLQFKNGKLIPKLVYTNFNKKDNINCFFYDENSKILYLGSTSKGLLIIKEKGFKALEGKNENGVYYALNPDVDSRILATSGEIFNDEKSFDKIVLNPINDGYILRKDRNGNLWTKANNVLICHTKESNFKRSRHWIFENRITEVIENTERKIIVATSIENLAKGEIYSLNLAESETTFYREMKVNFSTTFLLEGKKNEFWAGTSSGLYHVNLPQKKVAKIGPITASYVRNIYSNNADEIWFTTYESGLYLYRPSTKKLTQFPVDVDKFLLTSHCIIEDRDGFFWITTNKGLFQVAKLNLLRYASGKTANIYYHYYDKKSGFNTNEFNGGCNPCGLFLKNGNITFPSMDGIVYFNPKLIIPLLPNSEIYFNEAEVDGKKINLKDNCLTLDYNFERLDIAVSSPYYGNIQNLNLQIRLDGPQSQNWLPIKDQTVSFSSLPPGEYTLTARKLTGFDANFQYKTIKISIPPPFWKTLWFNLLMILLFFAVVYFVVRIRVKYIKRKNKILEVQIAEKTSQLRLTIKTLKKTEKRLSLEIINHKKLLRQITHDIKSPLRFLAMTGKHIYQNPDNEQDVKEGIESIYTSSAQIYNFVDNLLEYAKTNEKETIVKFNVYELIDEKIILFQNLAKSHNTKITNLINDKETSTGNKMLLSIIFHNLLDNAVKNTLGGEITFTSGKIEGKTFITIEDTGKGMSQEKVDYYNKKTNVDPSQNKEKKGTGLLIIRELLLIKRAQMIVESVKNQGTKITIILSLVEK